MPKESSELKIPVPYGHLAIKTWGDILTAEVKVLALHGWQDNAGSFDQLVPLLPDSFYVAAVDLPGHGLSSHLPKGCPYHDLVFMMEVKRVTDYLGLDKFTILGHSMGAAIAMFFACLFPGAVERVISIDMIKPLSFPPEELAKRTSDGIKFFLSLEERGDKPPVYDEKTSKEKLIASHKNYGVITSAAADCLLKRGAQSTDDGKGLFFTRDNRLKAVLFVRMESNALLSFLENMDCELFIIKAVDGIQLDPDSVNGKFIELYKKRCRRFKYVEVEGGHHVHLCQPDVVAPVVVDCFDGSNCDEFSSR